MKPYIWYSSITEKGEKKLTCHVLFRSIKGEKSHSVIWQGHATYQRASPQEEWGYSVQPPRYRNDVTVALHPRCYRYRQGRPVICQAVRLHGGKLQYSARIMVFSSSKVRLDMQPHRRQLLHERGHKSACLRKPFFFWQWVEGGGLIQRVVFALGAKASRQWDNQDWNLQEEKTQNTLLCFGGITRSSNVPGEVLCDCISSQNEKKNHFKSSFYSINRLFNYQLKDCLGAPTTFTTQSCSWHLISHKTLNFISLSSAQFIRRSHTSSTLGCLNYAARCHLPAESVSRAICVVSRPVDLAPPSSED